MTIRTYLQGMVVAAIFSSTLLMAGKEIEVKIQLNQDELENFQEWLIKHTEYKGEEQHTEYYLDNPQRSFYFDDKAKGFRDALGSLRIRRTLKDDKFKDSYCYKYRHLDPETGKTTHRDEHELVVENADTMLDIMTCLGYTERITIEKTRKLFATGDFEVCIDDVKNIGTFVEVELKKNDVEVKEGLALIYSFLKNHGLIKFKQYDRSYVHMITNPGFDFSYDVSL